MTRSALGIGRVRSDGPTDASQTPPPAPPESPPKGHETVLVVEDTEAVRDLTCAMLGRLGYTVLSAGNADEAAAMVRRAPKPIDVLLTDVVMPGMDGKALYARIRSIHPAPKVLFMAGYTHDVVAHHGALEEGVALLGKPFSLRDLALKMRAALDEGKGPS